MTTSKEIAFLERARQGFVHALAILDAADKLPNPDISDIDTLMNATRDLLGHHLEEIDDTLDALRAGGGT